MANREKDKITLEDVKQIFRVFDKVEIFSKSEDEIVWIFYKIFAHC